MAGHVIGLEFNGPGEVRVGLGRFALRQQGPGEVVVRPRVLRILGHGIGPDRDDVEVVVVAGDGHESKPDDGDAHQPGGARTDPAIQGQDDPANDCRQRQIHAVFRHGLGDDRHHTRARRQDHEKPGAQKTARRFSDQGPNRKEEKGQHDRRLPPNVGDGANDRRAIVNHQRMRPEREFEIKDNRLALLQKISPPGNAEAVARAEPPAPACAQQNPDEQQPGAGQGDVVGPALAPRRRETAGHERPVIKQHEQRRSHHHLLGAHADEAGEERKGIPPKGIGC